MAADKNDEKTYVPNDNDDESTAVNINAEQPTDESALDEFSSLLDMDDDSPLPEAAEEPESSPEPPSEPAPQNNPEPDDDKTQLFAEADEPAEPEPEPEPKPAEQKTPEPQPEKQSSQTEDKADPPTKIGQILQSISEEDSSGASKSPTFRTPKKTAPPEPPKKEKAKPAPTPKAQVKPEPKKEKSGSMIIVLAVVLVLALAGGGAYFFLFKDSAEEPVVEDIQVTETIPEPETTPEVTTESAPEPEPVQEKTAIGQEEPPIAEETVEEEPVIAEPSEQETVMQQEPAPAEIAEQVGEIPEPRPQIELPAPLPAPDLQEWGVVFAVSGSGSSASSALSAARGNADAELQGILKQIKEESLIPVSPNAVSGIEFLGKEEKNINGKTESTVLARANYILGAENEPSERVAPVLTSRIWTDSKTYHETDKISVYLRPNRDCNGVAVFVANNGDIVRLLPNGNRNIESFEADREYIIPGQGDAFSLEVAPPFGKDRVIFYAASQPLGKVKWTDVGNGLAIYSGSLSQFENNIFNLSTVEGKPVWTSKSVWNITTEK